MKSPTMADIAKEVGVSKMTVSKVFNDKPYVSNGTREKVLAVAEKLNYKHNLIASSMRSKKTMTLGLIISDSAFSFFPDIIKGIEDCANSNGYALILCITGGDYQTEREKIDLLLSKRVDGLILAASTLIHKEDVKFMAATGVPFLYAIRTPLYEKVDYVVNDNLRGSYTMVDYLIRTGSQKIHFLNMQSVSTSANKRLEGYKMALDKHGIPFDEKIIYSINHTIEAGYTQMKKLLSSGNGIETVFCGCDIIAIGVMQAVLDMGFKIPQDIRIASYDDIELAQYLQVPLTTVNQPKHEIGFNSVELLLKRINKPSKKTEAIILTPELCIRKST